MVFDENFCVCGAPQSNSEAAFPVADWNFGSTLATAVMRRCLRCGSLFPDKFPTAKSIHKAYQEYYTALPQAHGLGGFKRAILRRSIGKFASRHLPPHAKSVLDFGCGSGRWLSEIKAMNPHIEVFGTDVSAPTSLHRSIQWIEISNLPNSHLRFDWITLNHVLEHVEDPKETLRLLANLLGPDGAMWIATPNAHSYLFDVLKGRARDSDFPRHKHVFSRFSLDEMLQICGLTGNYVMPPLIHTILTLGAGLNNMRRAPLNLGEKLSYADSILATARVMFGPQPRKQTIAPEIALICRRNQSMEPLNKSDPS